MSSRRLKIAAAQLGPLNLADTRTTATQRLVKLLRDAHAIGAKFVVFPELALTTFFPRWWMEEQEEVDKYFEAQMPSPDVANSRRAQVWLTIKSWIHANRFGY